jgi:hypothetical protein
MLRKVVDSVIPKHVGFLQLQKGLQIYTFAVYTLMRRPT